MYPEKGTVSFSAGLHGWAFTLTSFAKIYSKRFGVEVCPRPCCRPPPGRCIACCLAVAGRARVLPRSHGAPSAHSPLV